MIILSMDSAAKSASVCLSEYKNNQLYPLSEINLNSTLTHSESLLPMINFCLENAGMTYDMVDISAISAGPGSFTGVRIGISTLMGLELARSMNNINFNTQADFEKNKNGEDCFPAPHSCVGVSTLLALALNVKCASVGDIICPLMDARRSQFYNGIFRKTKDGLKRLCDDRVITCQELIKEIGEKYPNKKIWVNGDGAELYLKLSDSINPKVKKCDNASLYENAFSVALALAYTDSYENILKNSEKYSCRSLSPIYLRQSQAERELKQKNEKK